MTLETAEKRAGEIVEILRPTCKRIMVAGSVRRRKALPKDIEVVCIPLHAADLFGESTQRHPAFAEAVGRCGKVVMGDPTTGKYVKVEIAGGAMLDLFIARDDNWGFIVTIRTGPADYSVLCMQRLRQAGLYAKDGTIWDPVKGPIACREERDFFEGFLGRKMPAPQERVA